MKNIIPLITCFVLLFTSCGKPPQTQTSPNPEAPITGPEVWNVNGTKFNIEGTALLVMGNGQTLFIVKALCDFAPDQTHRPLALAITKYAVDNGYPSKVKESSWNGKPTPPSDGIGVALFQKQTMGSVAMSSGCRYSFGINELKVENSEQTVHTNAAEQRRGN